MNMGEKIPTIVKPLITERGALFSEGIFQVTTIANNRDYSVNTFKEIQLSHKGVSQVSEPVSGAS